MENCSCLHCNPGPAEVLPEGRANLRSSSEAALEGLSVMRIGDSMKRVLGEEGVHDLHLWYPLGENDPPQEANLL